METQEELLQCFDEKIEWGWHMAEQLKLVEKVEGVDKLIRKIQQEVKFLKKVQFHYFFFHIYLSNCNALD